MAVLESYINGLMVLTVNALMYSLQLVGLFLFLCTLLLDILTYNHIFSFSFKSLSVK